MIGVSIILSVYALSCFTKIQYKFPADSVRVIPVNVDKLYFSISEFHTLIVVHLAVQNAHNVETLDTKSLIRHYRA